MIKKIPSQKNHKTPKKKITKPPPKKIPSQKNHKTPPKKIPSQKNHKTPQKKIPSQKNHKTPSKKNSLSKKSQNPSKKKKNSLSKKLQNPSFSHSFLFLFIKDSQNPSLQITPKISLGFSLQALIFLFFSRFPNPLSSKVLPLFVHRSVALFLFLF